VRASKAPKTSSSIHPKHIKFTSDYLSLSLSLPSPHINLSIYLQEIDWLDHSPAMVIVCLGFQWSGEINFLASVSGSSSLHGSKTGEKPTTMKPSIRVRNRFSLHPKKSPPPPPGPHAVTQPAFHQRRRASRAD